MANKVIDPNIEWGRALFLEMPQDGSVVRLHPPITYAQPESEKFELGGRLSSRNVRIGDQIKEQITGGCKLWIRLRAPGYGGPAMSYEKRLAPGYKTDQFYGAVRGLLVKARAEHLRMLMAEDVFRLSQSILNSEAFVQAIDQTAEENGRNASYHEMTEHDCRFWMEFLQTWKEPQEVAA